MRADIDANQRFYGKRLDGAQLVLNNASVEAPTPVPEWIQTLSRHIALSPQPPSRVMHITVMRTWRV